MNTIALVYSKDASRRRAGMDLIRWTEMGRQLALSGWGVHLVTDRTGGVVDLLGLPVVDAATASWDQYDAIKVCYQHSIDLVPPHPCIIARMCRVADEERPARDGSRRVEMLRQQQRIHEIAHYVALNDWENVRRWRSAYGDKQRALIVPTGCPESIPKPMVNPYERGRRVVLFCGSLTAPRFVSALRAIAESLRSALPEVDVHFVGRNRLHVYGASGQELDPDLITLHPPVEVGASWQYILHADVGLALAPSHDAFESELAKIYYYLRAGLPVVTESSVLNRSLVAETGHGSIATYDDIPDLTDKIIGALKLAPQSPDVMHYMATTHSWRQRAAVYTEALGSLAYAH